MTDSQLKDVRAALYVFSTTPPVPDKATLEKLDDLNSAIIDGTWGLWYDFAVIQKLRDFPANEPYRASIQALLDIVAGVSVPPPAPPTATPEPTGHPESYPVFSSTEIQLLGDLNYSARTALGHSGPLVERLLVLAKALKDGTWPTWMDVDRSYIASLMGSTKDGLYQPNRDVLLRFADGLGLAVSQVSFPASASPVTPPAPVVQPAPSGVVPVHGEPIPDGLSETARAVIAALAELNIHARRNKMSVGMLPVANNAAGFQVGGDASPSMIGMSNAHPDGSVRGTDGQNANEIHINTWHLADNDGGVRVSQYTQWLLGGTGVTRVRNTTNRPGTTMAFMDSFGDMCCSDDRFPKGQFWYIVKRAAEGFADFCTYQIGHRPRLMAANGQYAANDVKVIEEVVRRVLAEKGL